MVHLGRLKLIPEKSRQQTMTVCALCKSTDTVPYATGLRDYITGLPFSIERCPHCGLAFTTPQPDRMDRFYPQGYRRFGRRARLVLEYLYNRRARTWVRSLGAPGSALEIGAGAGWMLRALRRYGWRVVGNERSVQGSVAVLAKDGLPVFVGGLEALRPAPQFDLIILFQVLEHLGDPLSVLQHCARLLKPGGTLLVAVPNLDSWQAKLCGAHWFHLDAPRHLFHFNPASLSQALETVGLKVQTIAFSSFEHDPYGWVQSILNAMGFESNRLTRMLMGLDPQKTSRCSGVGMLLFSGLLLLPCLAASVVSWMARAGALMEISAVKPVRLDVAAGLSGRTTA